MQAWTIINTTTGEVVHPCYKTQDDQHPVDDGFVAAPDLEFIPLDEAPDPAIYEWDGEQWVLSVDKLRPFRIAKLKVIRDQQEFSTIVTAQGVLQIDERSQGRMHRTTELGRTYEAATGQPFGTEWRMNDNSMVPINLGVLTEWAMLIGQHIQTTFAHYATLYAALEAATTMEELDAVDIEGGWNA